MCGLLSDATYCGKLFLLENATVSPMVNKTGHIGRNVSVECVVKHITRLSVVKFLRNDTELTRLNVTDLSVTSSRDTVALAGEERGEGRERRFVAVLTMSNLSCSDGGQYVCVAEDGDHWARQTTTLLITRELSHLQCRFKKECSIKTLYINNKKTVTHVESHARAQ